MRREPPRMAATKADRHEALECGCVVLTREDVNGRRWTWRPQRCMKRSRGPEHVDPSFARPQLVEEQDA